MLAKVASVHTWMSVVADVLGLLAEQPSVLSWMAGTLGVLCT